MCSCLESFPQQVLIHHIFLCISIISSPQCETGTDAGWLLRITGKENVTSGCMQKFDLNVKKTSSRGCQSAAKLRFKL